MCEDLEGCEEDLWKTCLEESGEDIERVKLEIERDEETRGG